MLIEISQFTVISIYRVFVQMVNIDGKKKMIRYLIICKNPTITIQIYIQKMVRYLILSGWPT